MSLNLLAFLFHTVLDLVNYTYQKVCELLVTRTTFFKDIRTLLKYLWFKDWSHLFSQSMSHLKTIPVNEITLSLETLTVQGIQALDPNDNYCPKQPFSKIPPNALA